MFTAYEPEERGAIILRPGTGGSSRDVYALFYKKGGAVITRVYYDRDGAIFGREWKGKGDY